MEIGANIFVVKCYQNILVYAFYVKALYLNLCHCLSMKQCKIQPLKINKQIQLHLPISIFDLENQKHHYKNNFLSETYDFFGLNFYSASLVKPGLPEADPKPNYYNDKETIGEADPNWLG